MSIYERMSDGKLVVCARGADRYKAERARNQLFTKYMPLLTSIVRKAELPASEQADAMQAVSIGLLRAITLAQPERYQTIAPLVDRLATFEVLDLKRRLARSHTHEGYVTQACSGAKHVPVQLDDVAMGEVDRLTAHDGGIAAVIQRIHMQDQIAKLSASDRGLLREYVIAAGNAAEVARRAGVSRQAVNKRLSAIRSRYQ